jgi:hypothetical protein
MDRPSCFVAADDCASPLASCSVAAAMRSEAVAWRVSCEEGLAPTLPAGAGAFDDGDGFPSLEAPEDIFDLLTNAM